MCGRYVLAIPSDEIAQAFAARFAFGAEAGYSPSFNIPPTAQVLALGESDDGGRLLELYRWGLIPPRTKDAASGPPMHNARAETVATKPSFRAAFSTRRVAIIAQGYYEWRRAPGTPLQPFFISRTDGGLLAFASLWESWRRDEHTVRSTAIVTTAAGPDTEAIHDRTPMILERDTLDLWLDRGEEDREILETILGPAPRGTLVARPVGPRVGKVREDDAGLIDPFEPDRAPPAPEALTLF
jgi:putative SOS response-associated peptidase YedK